MSSEILKTENNYISSDRRQVSVPMENDRRSGRDRRLEQRAAQEESIHNAHNGVKHHKHSKLAYAFEALPPVRRLSSIPDKIENGEIASALGLAGLALINFPEDLRDIQSGAEQIASRAKGMPLKNAYDYKNFQHEFSFFRGTLLEPLVDINNAKNVGLARKLYKMDQSLLKTNFGKKVLAFLNTTTSEYDDVKKYNKTKKIMEVAQDINKEERVALGFEGGWFGKLTARAMARTTLFGVAALALLEAPKIYKSVTEDGSLGEKVDDTAKQVTKSAINVASTTAGIAYGGAIGSKYGKSFGSLVGMGIGAILGTKASEKLQSATA